MIVFINGAADVIIGIDPTGELKCIQNIASIKQQLTLNHLALEIKAGFGPQPRLAWTVPDHSTVENKALVASALMHSFLFHGLVRVAGARELHRREVRMVLLASYLGAMYQGSRLVAAGAMTFPHASTFTLWRLSLQRYS